MAEGNLSLFVANDNPDNWNVAIQFTHGMAVQVAEDDGRSGLGFQDVLTNTAQIRTTSTHNLDFAEGIAFFELINLLDLGVELHHSHFLRLELFPDKAQLRIEAVNVLIGDGA